MHVPAHGQTFPTPERVEGERYRIPVKKLRVSPLMVFAEDVPSNFIFFGSVKGWKGWAYATKKPSV